MFRTLEWQRNQEQFGMESVCRTLTIASDGPQGAKTHHSGNMVDLFHLNGIRGDPGDEQSATEAYRAMSLQQRMQESKAWACYMLGTRPQSGDLNNFEQAHEAVCKRSTRWLSTSSRTTEPGCLGGLETTLS